MLFYDAVVGMDPGKLGAIVVLSTETGLILESYRMKDEVPYLMRTMRSIQKRYDAVMVALEKAQAGAFGVKRQMGGKSMFTYGKHVGHLEAVIEVLSLPCQQIHPRTWTNEMHQGYEKQGDGPKDRSRYVALSMWPLIDLKFPGKAVKAHEGLVDAALIAEFVRRRVK